MSILTSRHPTPAVTPAGALRPTGSVSLTLIALAAVVGLLYFGRVLLITLVISTILAFLLEPAVVAVMRLRLPRAVASLLVCGMAGGLVYLAGFGIYTQASGLLQDLPEYSERVNLLVDKLGRTFDEWEKSTYRLLPRRSQPETPPPPNTRRRRAAEPLPAVPAVPEVRIRPEPTPLYRYLYDSISGLYNVLLMASFVPFLVYFMLSWRDHMRRSLLQLFSDAEQTAANRSWSGVAGMTRGYVVGNFQLGLLLALASTAFFWAVDLPYWTLVGPLSGFLSLVPYVGLPLAIVPAFLAALAVHDTLTPYLIIAAVVSLLHLIALNFVYPKLVGSRVHLNPLVVTVALMFWGTVWGAPGLVLAVPITAGIKAVCDNVDHLRGYGHLLGD